MTSAVQMGWDYGLKKRRVRSVNTTPNLYQDFTDADAAGRFYSHSVEFLGVDGLAYTTDGSGVKARVADNNCYPVVPNGGATDSTHPISINWTGNSTSGYTVTLYSDLISWSTPLDSLGGAHMAQANMFHSISEDSAGTGVGGTGPLPRPDQMQTAVTFNYAATVQTDGGNPTGRGWDRVLTGLQVFINGLFYYLEIDHLLVGNYVATGNDTHYNGDARIFRFTPGETNGGINYLILDAAAYGLTIPTQNVNVPLTIPWGRIIIDLVSSFDPLTGRTYIHPPTDWTDTGANFVANCYIGHETQSTYGTNTGLFRLAISGIAHTALVPDPPSVAAAGGNTQFACYVLDSSGTPQNSVTVHTINTGLGNQITVPVTSRLAGVRAVSLTPQGGCIDKMPQFSFTVPLAVWKNAAAAPGAQILVVDADLAASVANAVTQGPVATRGVAVSADGESATITCDDLLYDLVRADVTSGFATGTGETTTTTLLRLIGPTADPRLVETNWTVINEVTGFDGVAFVSAPASVLTAADALRVQRYAHWKRAGGRVFHFGNFGTPFLDSGATLRLQKAMPGQVASKTPGIRIITSVSFTTEGRVVNTLTPVGGGSGISELTLRTLYGNTTFAGFNPVYPVLRRKRADAGGFDTYDYYIEDVPSLVAYGRTRDRLVKTEIAPVVSTTGGVSAVDEAAAAGALYSVCVSELLRRKDPRTQLTLVTDGWGDFRDAGGHTVRVRYQGVAWDEQDKLNVTIDVNDDYTVLDCVIAEDDQGVRKATWTLSSNGEPVASAGSFIAGVAGQLTALQGAVGTAYLPVSKHVSTPIGPGAPARLTIYPDNGMVRQHYMTAYVTTYGLRHTRADNGHTQDVVTETMSHDVAQLKQDIANLGLRLITSGGAVHNTINGDVTYDPGTHIKLNNQASKPGSAMPVYFDGTAWYWDGTNTVDNTLNASPVTLSIIPATTGGTGGATQPTSGGKGGTVPKTTHAAGSGYGAQLAVATVEDVYEGPQPTGVTLWVNNVQVAAITNGVGVIDLNPYTNGQGQFDLEVRCLTPGSVDFSIEGLRDRAALAITPPG